MKRHEATSHTPADRADAPVRLESVPPRRFSSKASRLRAARDAFCQAHEAIAGRPAGSSRFDITFAEDPAAWSYSGRLIPGKFAGTDLAKANLEVTACISRLWGDNFGDHPWEPAIAAAELLPLGAEPLAKLPRHAEAGWHVHSLSKCFNGTPYVLDPWHVHALQAGPVIITRLINAYGPSKSLAEAGKILRKTITARVTERLQG